MKDLFLIRCTEFNRYELIFCPRKFQLVSIFVFTHSRIPATTHVRSSICLSSFDIDCKADDINPFQSLRLLILSKQTSTTFFIDLYF
jgi:hypothetical protein